MATLESLVSPDRFRGKIDRVIDFTFVRERVADLYRPDNGRPALARDKVHDAAPRQVGDRRRRAVPAAAYPTASVIWIARTGCGSARPTLAPVATRAMPIQMKPTPKSGGGRHKSEALPALGRAKRFIRFTGSRTARTACPHSDRWIANPEGARQGRPKSETVPCLWRFRFGDRPSCLNNPHNRPRGFGLDRDAREKIPCFNLDGERLYKTHGERENLIPDRRAAPTDGPDFRLVSDYRPWAINQRPFAICETDTRRDQVLLSVTGSENLYHGRDHPKNPAPRHGVGAEQDSGCPALRGNERFFPTTPWSISLPLRLLPTGSLVPRSDTYIEKDASINERIDRMRHSATRALLERRDVILSPPSPVFMASAPWRPTRR